MKHWLFNYLTKFFYQDLPANKKIKGLSDVNDLKDAEKVSLLKESRSKIVFPEQKSELMVDFDTKDKKSFFKYVYKNDYSKKISYGLIYLYSDCIFINFFVSLNQLEYENASSKSALMFDKFDPGNDFDLFKVDGSEFGALSCFDLHSNTKGIFHEGKNAFLNEFNLNLFKVMRSQE